MDGPANPKTFFLVAVGSHGDVLPFLALGCALRDRGHRIALAAPAPFAAMASRAGLDFTALATETDYAAAVGSPDLWHPRRGMKPLFDFVARTTGPILRWLETEAVPTPNAVVVAQPQALGARVAQDLHGLPTITLHVMPLLMESATAPPRLPGLPLPRFLPAAFRHWLAGGADRYVLAPTVLPPLNAYRAGLGLPPVGRLRFWWNSPTRVILMFPGWYAPRQSNWPAQAVQTGFPIADSFGDFDRPSPELAAFLASGPPPLAFTYGSAMSVGDRFFETAVRICRRMGRRGVLVAPRHEQIPADLPAGVIHQSYVPFGALLPRCAALIHHGGIGTVVQALAAGIPQLIVPVAFDHFDEARRVTAGGLGATLSRRFGPRKAARLLERLLASERVARACAEARARVGAHDGIRDACEQAEAVPGWRGAGERRAEAPLPVAPAIS